MAREHARILTRIWRDDDDWRALDWEAQHMYLLLVSQPTLSYAGTLPLRLRGWSLMTTGRSPGEIEKTIRVLEERRFVVVDWDTEELLIRSFIRNDGVYKQPNILKAAMRVALEELESARLKLAIAAELARVGLTEYAARLDPSRNPSPDPSPNPSGKGKDSQVSDGLPPEDGKGSANPSGKGSGGGSQGVTRETRGRGEGRVVKSQSVGGSVSRPAQQRGTRLPDDFTVTDDMRQWAREHTPLVGKAETDAFIDYWRAIPGAKGCKLDWQGTWRNWMRRANADAERRPNRGHLRAVAGGSPEEGFWEQ